MNMGSYGYDRDTSPRLDRLLAGGARFQNARTVEPLTAPALASMLTSLQPHEHGSTRNGLRIRPNLFSFTKSLGRRGYETATFAGNWTLKDELSGFAEHFETYEVLLNRKRWFGMIKSEATADDLVDLSLSWLDAHLDGSDRPFLIWVHMIEPHAPYRLRGDFLKQDRRQAGRHSPVAQEALRLGDRLCRQPRRPAARRGVRARAARRRAGGLLLGSW